MILVFFIFITCIFLLNKWLYKPLLEFMDSRESMIKQDMEAIEANYEETKKINEEINKIIEGALKSANEIKSKATIESKLTYDKKINEVKALHERELLSFMVKLEREKEELKNNLLEEIPEIKLSLTNKLGIRS